MMYKEKHR